VTTAVLLGLDIGTSGARCVAVDDKGRVVASAVAQYPLLSPRPGWSEQNPETWWEAARAVIAGAAAEAGGEVTATGLTGQMHGAVFLDAKDEVIRPALLWNDQRTAAQADAITRRIGAQRLNEIAGNPALTGFQAPKILWLRDEEPDRYARVATVMLPKDYVRLRLTGEKSTDVSDASGTLLLDLRKRDWSEEILDALDIPSSWLPPVYESPQVAAAGDNAAAAIGTGIIRDGLASCSIGTSGVLFAHTDALSLDPQGRLHAFCHAVPGRYHLMGVTLAAGGALRWWRDLIGETDYDRLTERAATAPPGSEGLVFLPYLTGERSPHLDPHARGVFFGLTSRHDLGHMTRAVMEGVAFSLRDSLEVMQELGASPREVRATGAGTRNPFWLQLLADVFARPIVRTVVDEGPAYGAALLAGVAAGAFASVEEACESIEISPDVCEPDQQRARLYDEYYSAYRSLYPATAGTMHALSRLASEWET
jgi:xylulokinase